MKPAMNSCDWGEFEKVGDEVLRELETQKSPNLIVDLSEMDYISSAMVALIVRVWKAVKAKHAKMVVVNRHALVLEVLKIAKLDAVWTIVEYREDALYELGVSKEAKTERHESNVLGLASVFNAVVATAAFGLHVAKPGVLTAPVLQFVVFGFSAIGFVLGLLLFLKGYGGQKTVGILATLLCLAVFIGGVLLVPFSGNEEPKPDENPPANVRKTEKTTADEEPAKSLKTTDPGKTLQPAVAE
jgi:anti-anti-sigma factor